MMKPPKAERRLSPSDLSWLRVLVVDDEPEVVKTVRGMLRDIGVTQSSAARDGREAVDFLRLDDDGIEVLITDWNMPRMTGPELLMDARSGHPELAVLLITGRADAESVAQARELGVKNYLRKPFSALDLQTKLTLISKQILLARGQGARAA